MSDAMGSKNRCRTFSTEFFDGEIQSKKSRFSTGSPSRKTQSKKNESKKPFFDCVRKPDLGFSRKRPFSTDKSDCVRNGLTNMLSIHKRKLNIQICQGLFIQTATAVRIEPRQPARSGEHLASGYIYSHCSEYKLWGRSTKHGQFHVPRKVGPATVSTYTW